MGLKEVLPTDFKKSGWPWDVETPTELYDQDITYPKITIVTPSYNQGEFLEETIRSVLLQNYPNLEYIIVDGGSKDSSVEIIKKYEKWITHWVSEPDKGQSHALNKGFYRATGDVLNWINSDDFLAKEALFHVGSVYLNRQNNNLVIVGNAYECNIESTMTRERRIKEPLEWQIKMDYILPFSGSPTQQSLFYTRKLYFEAGGINPFIRYPMDIELYVKFGYLKPEVIILKKFLGFFRVHGNSKTYGQSLPMLLEKINLFKNLRYYLDSSYCNKQIGYYIIGASFAELNFKDTLTLLVEFVSSAGVKELHRYRTLFTRMFKSKKHNI